MINGDRQGGNVHIDFERMLAYAHGECDSGEAAAVIGHGRACSDCGDQLAVMIALATSAVAEDATPLAGGRPVARPRAPHAWLGAAAATVVLALLVGAAMLAGFFDFDAADPRGGAGAPGAGTAADITHLATTTPPNALELEFLFGAGAPAADAPRARTGFALIVADRYDEAVRQLEPLHDADPADGEVAATLGIALYLSGDDGARVEELLRRGAALPQQSFANLAAWYLGNLYTRRGDLVQAMQVLEPLSNEPDDAGARAGALLEQLRSEAR